MAESARAEATKRGPRPQRRQHLFTKELSSLMFAHGDVPDSLPESVQVLDEIVTEYIIEMCHEAAKMATHAKRNKIKVEDFKFALRKEPQKLGRLEHLLSQQKVFNDARKQFDDSGSNVEPK